MIKKTQLDDFIEQANKFHPNIKFTAEISQNEITFLDIVVKRERFINESILDSKTHYQPLKPFNIHISTHAIHPVWKMVSLKVKQ